MRYGIDHEQLSDFLTRQVRPWKGCQWKRRRQRLTATATGWTTPSGRPSGWRPGLRRSLARRSRTSQSGSSSRRATAARSRGGAMTTETTCYSISEVFGAAKLAEVQRRDVQ